MPQQKSIWVEGIEQEIAKAPSNRILLALIAAGSVLLFYFLDKKPDILGAFQGLIMFVLFCVVFIAIVNIIESKKEPDYLAYYLYKIGEELDDFEIEDNYLTRNRNYIKNCRKQLLYLIGDGQTDLRPRYFIKNVTDFIDKIYNIITRLNFIYSRGYMNEVLMTKLEGMSSEPFTNEKDFLSSNLIALANLIHKDHSTLTHEHIDLTDKILNELKDLPEKPIQKSLLEYAKEIWNKLSYNSKYQICVILTFIIPFAGFSQLLIYFKQEEAYSYALVATVALATYVLPKIERFIARERTKFN